MKILIKYSPEVIKLRGDKEADAVANYIYNKYGCKIIDNSFACNFLNKYNGTAILHEINGIKFFYPVFNK